MSKLQLILKFLSENTVKFRSWLIRWFPLRIKQRLHWFRKSTITMTRTIFAFYLQTYWCTHRIIVARIVTQNLLNWNQDGHRRVWYDVIFVCKASKKKYSKGNREQRFWTKKISEKYLFLSMFFWLFSNMQGYFLKFSVSDSSWLDRSGGLLILFSWLSFSEPISIYILLNPSLSPFMTEADII